MSKSKTIHDELADTTAEEVSQPIEQPQDEPEKAVNEEQVFSFGSFNVGSEAIAEQEELDKIEGSFMKVSDFTDNRAIVVPLQYRFTNNFLPNVRETLRSLITEKKYAEAQELLDNIAVNCISEIKVHQVELPEAAVGVFNNALPDGSQKLMSRMTFATWDNQDDPLSWLASPEKDAEWFKQNVISGRNPVNVFKPKGGAVQVTPSRIKTESRVTIPFIDSNGAMRYIQSTLNTRHTFSKAFDFRRYTTEGDVRDDSTEWIGRAVQLIRKDARTWEFRILASNDKLSDAQIDRMESDGQIAQDLGHSKRHIYSYGMPHNSKVRELLLDFFGVRSLYEAR